jgi:hypothetical protein
MSMLTEDTVLDWTDENLTIEYQRGKYFLNFWSRDVETGGWDVVREEEYRSMYDALTNALKHVDDLAAEDRRIQAMQEESDREQALRYERNED